MHRSLLSHVFSYLFMFRSFMRYSFFFFNDTATTEIYTLSLHDALPIYQVIGVGLKTQPAHVVHILGSDSLNLHPDKIFGVDRKSTRLNSSHSQISYAVFCLKKKNKRLVTPYTTI